MSGFCKYYRQKRQVSYDNGVTWQDVIPMEYRRGGLYESDSADCGYGDVTRWVIITGDYLCDGTDKYQKMQKQISYDGGSTWQNVSPAEYQKGALIEADSTDCGAVTIYDWIVDGYICEECGTSNNKAVINTSSSNPIFIQGNGEISRSETSAYTSAATDVVITSQATSIGNDCFSGFTSLEFARIPNSVTSIGNNAFNGCYAMFECGIPSGVTSIGDDAFFGCTSLAYIDIPDTVTSIGVAAFMSCLNFRYASIPSSITAIPANCFCNCDGLSDIELPSTITSIGNEAFRDCGSLYTVTCLATTPPTLGTNVFTSTNVNLKIYVPQSAVDAYKSAWSNYSSKINPIT